MRKFLLLAGAAAMAAAAPAIAKGGPGGGHGGGMSIGHGKSHTTTTTKVHSNGHETSWHSRSVTKSHSTKVTAKVRPTSLHSMAMRPVKTHGRHSVGFSPHDEALAHKYGGSLCPPGLWKKTPSCMPPGQARRLFRDGQHIPPQYKYYTPYGDIPSPLVTQYSLTDQYRYIYRNNVIYVVDPTTNLVTRIINAVL